MTLAEQNEARNLKIIELHEKYTLKEIGEKVSLSPERVRQILSENGIVFAGSAREKARKKDRQERLEAERQRIEDRHKRIFGVSRQEIKKIPRDKRASVKRMYLQQKRLAEKKGIKCKISVVQYWDIWAKSKKFNKRGTKKGDYGINRINFDKDITVKNLVVEKRSTFAKRLGTYAAKCREKN